MNQNPVHSIEARKQRWNDFFSGSQQHVFQIQYQPDERPRPQPWPDKKEERITWAWERYQRHMERIEWLLDDSLPYLDVFTGTEIFAEAFGCEVHRAQDNMPFAMPRVHNAYDAAMLKVPPLESTPLMLLFEIADELRARAGTDALLRLVDIQTPMDITALIWDKNDLYLAMLETPEAVKEVAQKVKQLCMTFLDEWFRRYGKEFIAHYPTYYMSQGITVSEDEVGAVSEEMFEEFFLPELVEYSEHYGGIGVHCCAHARHQWDHFRRLPNLKLLNLVQPVDVLRDAYEYFAPHVPQMHSWLGSGDPWTWPEQHPAGVKLVIETHAATREQAVEISQKLWTSLRKA